MNSRKEGERMRIRQASDAQYGRYNTGGPYPAGGSRLTADGAANWNRWAAVYQARLDQWTYEELLAYRARTGHPVEDLRELWARAETVYRTSRLEPWPEKNP